MEKRLYRSRDERVIWGVCGGLAEYFDIDPVIVRVITVVLALASGAGIIAYIILAIVLPLKNSKAIEPKDVVKENIEDLKQSASELGNEIRSTFGGEKDTSKDTSKTRQKRHNALGIILIVAGGLFLLAIFNPFPWFQWRYLWPLILIGIGLLVIVGSRRK
ncbi:MAG: PspC domain-containing protein [Dehalococcoidales bacterium]